MKTITTSILAFACAMAFAFIAFADTWTDPATDITWTYKVSDGKASIYNNGNVAISKSTTGAITIPSMLGGCPVTSIGSYAFSSCSNLTSVTIPSSVTSIGGGAFEDCSGIMIVTIPSNVTSIGYGAFSGCRGLTSVTIPSSVTSIGAKAFEGCSSLTSVTIPARVTKLSSTFPDSYQSITNVVICEGVTSISNEAFFGCSSLTSITISSSVTRIGSSAFYDCSSLKNITFEGDIPDFGDDVFEGTPKRMVINIPSDGFGWDYYEKYGQIPPWGIRNVVVTNSTGGDNEGKEKEISTNVNLTITNIVVHYIQTSELSPMTVPITKDVGIVNVMTEIKGNNVAIPESWEANYPTFAAKFGSDFASALTKPTGKYDGAGNAMMVWQDYVAGTDPTDENDVFKASVTMVEGKVKVSYTPELSAEEANKRVYKTLGKVKLTDTDWVEVPTGSEGDYNFFKVTVEMK